MPLPTAVALPEYKRKPAEETTRGSGTKSTPALIAGGIHYSYRRQNEDQKGKAVRRDRYLDALQGATPLNGERPGHGVIRRDARRDVHDARVPVMDAAARHGYDLHARWLEILTRDGAMLENAGTAARERDLVFAAIRNYGLALHWASDELKDDRDLVYVAVKQCGLALQYASPRLKRDRKLVLTAGRENVHALQYAAPELRGDSEFMHRGFREHLRKLKWQEQQEVLRIRAESIYRKVTYLDRVA